MFIGQNIYTQKKKQSFILLTLKSLIFKLFHFTYLILIVWVSCENQ